MEIPSYTAAREALLRHAAPVGTECVPLDDAAGRILAEALIAADNVPPFDRSPYDGYAFRACDIAGAGEGSPVTLRITEEIPAGAVPTLPVGPGQCAKILTGAPIPDGADTVLNFEQTRFTDSEVTFFAPVAPGRPMCARACAANVELRAMVKYPTTPAASAMHRPAMNALSMKGDVMVETHCGS